MGTMLKKTYCVISYIQRLHMFIWTFWWMLAYRNTCSVIAIIKVIERIHCSLWVFPLPPPASNPLKFWLWCQFKGHGDFLRWRLAGPSGLRVEETAASHVLYHGRSCSTVASPTWWTKILLKLRSGIISPSFPLLLLAVHSSMSFAYHIWHACSISLIQF